MIDHGPKVSETVTNSDDDTSSDEEYVYKPRKGLNREIINAVSDHDSSVEEISFLKKRKLE